MGKWDVYRDKDGKPVTITEEQGNAIWYAIAITDQVRRAENYELLSEGAGAFINISKSRLLGRMLYDGKPPLDEKPPVEWGGPAYYRIDPDMCDRCGGDKDKPGRTLHWNYEAGKPVTKTVCCERWHREAAKEEGLIEFK